MVNYIWSFFLITGILYSIITGRVELLNKEILDSTSVSLNIILKIMPIMALWLGLMQIAIKSGLIKKFTKLIMPLLKKLFPEIPNNHESLDYISSNVIANMLGLGNAATPFGLKAMKSLQDLNNKKTASKSMITFLVLNTCGFTIIPTTVISLRIANKSNNPTIIISYCILVSFFSLFFALLINSFLARKYFDNNK